MPEQDLSSNQFTIEIIKYIFAFLGGGIAFLLKEKYQNRKFIFTKKIYGQRLGFSVQSQDWGDIQILYNEQPSNNLHIITAEILNTSNKDFPNLIFEFSVPDSSTIYRHQGQLLYDDITKQLLLEKTFNDYFGNIKEQYNQHIENEELIENELQKEINFITRHRRFYIPLIKGNTKSVFHFLVEDNNDNPHLNVSILEPNLKLIQQPDETEESSVKKKWTEYGGLVIFIIFAYPIYCYSTTILTAILLMILNLFIASIIALGIYHLVKWLKRLT